MATARCFLDHMTLIKWRLTPKQAKFYGTQKQKVQWFSQDPIPKVGSLGVVLMTMRCIALMLLLAKFCGLSTPKPKRDIFLLAPELLTEWATSSTRMGIFMLLT